MSILRAVGAAAALIPLYVILRVIYNLFFHPLRSYPGPLIGRATAITAHGIMFKGEMPLWIHQQHLKYGPVVRYAPNELSYIDPGVWKEVYGYGERALTKNMAFYGPDIHGSPPGILRAPGPAHGRQRRLISYAFSDKALRDQESLFKGYVVQLLEKLKAASANGAQLDLVRWYNYTSFDIMGDLTFGEPLKLLEGSDYNPWVSSVFGYVKLVLLNVVIRAWKLDGFVRWLIPQKVLDEQRNHARYASDRVQKRLATKTDRPDIWTYVLKHSEDEEHKGKGLQPTEMLSNGGLFMLAGTETTATSLSGLTFMLLKDPPRMARLVKEIRSAFSTLDELTLNELPKLPYLNACIEEGLRIYPPVPVLLPRNVPREGAMIGGKWVSGGTTVGISQFAAYHSPTNFKDPDSFAPERWMPEGESKYGSDRKAAFQPFSVGPRNCVGKNLAYHEMRLILASVLLNFDIELCDETQNWLDQENYLLWEKGPLMTKLRPVKLG